MPDEVTPYPAFLMSGAFILVRLATTVSTTVKTNIQKEHILNHPANQNADDLINQRKYGFTT